jgi:hypothetical protein
LLAGSAWQRFVREWVSHIFCLHSVPTIELFFERKNHQHLADIFLYLLDAAFAPGPELRADVVNDRDVQLAEFACETKVEVGKVDEDGCVWLAPGCFANQSLELPPDQWKMADDFRQPHNRNLMRVHHGFGASVSHALAAHTEELGARRTTAKGVDDACAVKFS